MEFVKLSVASRNVTYGRKAEHCIQLLHKLYPEHGLLPYFISPEDGGLMNDHITFGAMGDSYYECALLPRPLPRPPASPMNCENPVVTAGETSVTAA